MPGRDVRARSVERIERLVRTPDDSRSLRLQVLAELRRVVGLDAYAWVVTDPVTTVGASPLADVPWLAELPRQIRGKYLSAVNRWTALGGRPVATLHEETGGELRRSLVWRDLLEEYDVVDAASVVFEDRFGCWAFLELWRCRPAAPFDREDAAVLAQVAPVLTRALRHAQADGFMVRPTGDRPRVGPVVLLLSSQLHVSGQTPASAEYLRRLVPPAEGAQPVPAVAYNVAAQLLANEAGVDAHAPTARVALPDGVLVTARAARIEGPRPPSELDIAVSIEEASAPERVDLFGRAFGLSDRERELLVVLAGGSGTREVARRLCLSEHTVQDHLKSMFAKTGVHTRRSLLALALGT